MTPRRLKRAITTTYVVLGSLSLPPTSKYGIFHLFIFSSCTYLVLFSFTRGYIHVFAFILKAPVYSSCSFDASERPITRRGDRQRHGATESGMMCFGGETKLEGGGRVGGGALTPSVNLLFPSFWLHYLPSVAESLVEKFWGEERERQHSVLFLLFLFFYNCSPVWFPILPL